VLQQSALRRRSLIVIELVLLALIGYYFFIVFAFFGNGLHHYSYDDIWWQRTPTAGDFPFTEPASLGLVGFVLLLAAMLIATIGSVVVPVASLWVAMKIRSQWHALKWPERGLWFITTAGAGIATLIMWSPLGRAITTWIID
jgi:hypothetical protein